MIAKPIMIKSTIRISTPGLNSLMKFVHVAVRGEPNDHMAQHTTTHQVRFMQTHTPARKAMEIGTYEMRFMSADMMSSCLLVGSDLKNTASMPHSMSVETA